MDARHYGADRSFLAPTRIADSYRNRQFVLSNCDTSMWDAHANPVCFGVLPNYRNGSIRCRWTVFVFSKWLSSSRCKLVLELDGSLSLVQLLHSELVLATYPLL